MVPEKINLLTIKWGDKFPPAYPNLIHRMAKRHMPCKFDSYCMTDDPTDLDDDIIPVETTEKWLWNDILGKCQGSFIDNYIEHVPTFEIMKKRERFQTQNKEGLLHSSQADPTQKLHWLEPFLEQDYFDVLEEITGPDIILYPGPTIEDPELQWWFWDAVKMSIFAPKLCGIEGKILFSDLDNLFLNRLDRIVQTTPPAIIKTDWNPNYHIPMHGGNYFLTMGFNASLIYIDNTSPVTKQIWDHFVKHYEQARGSLYSSDAYLWRCHRDKINTYPELTVYSHSRGSKYPDQTKGKLRSNHEVCIFMEDTEPDPLDIKEGWEADLCKQYL